MTYMATRKERDQITFLRAEERKQPKAPGKTSAEIDAEIDKFIAIGGRIRKIQMGESGYVAKQSTAILGSLSAKRRD